MDLSLGLRSEGSATLADLFRGRSQLLIYHFMFGPDYAAGCMTCSSIADGFNGITVHLAHHDVMLWAVSRAPIAKLKAYKQRMGWTFPWASDLKEAPHWPIFSAGARSCSSTISCSGPTTPPAV